MVFNGVHEYYVELIVDNLWINTSLIPAKLVNIRVYAWHGYCLIVIHRLCTVMHMILTWWC